MGLSNRQKKWIIKNQKKLSTKKIVSKLNISENIVKQYISTQSTLKTRKLFYFILLLIPISFFILLEISLQFFNYGIDTSTWSKVNRTHLMLNNQVARRYFHSTKNVPNSIQDVFSIEKKENSYRVFVLGGSSAAGYPYMPVGSFSRYIRKRLELVYPNTNIEVINLGLTAVNSYTIRDFVPDILEQQPDLIIVYAGHNEYYGALGVGSMESLGRVRFVVNMLLDLNGYKTVELLRNFIKSVISVLIPKEKPERGETLMSRMAQEKHIPYESDLFNLGIEQFEGNIRDLIEMVKEENVPLIISTLSCNIKDLPPFVSKSTKSLPSALSIYNSAVNELENGNLELANSLFRKSKDLDMLRFRAPERINEVINSLGVEYNIPVVNIDSVFASASLSNIVGNNLFIDHLHPSLEGYQLIGERFYNSMNISNYLPYFEDSNILIELQDSVTKACFNYTVLDSTISDYKIKLLKNDYPFIHSSKSIQANLLLNPKTYIDSVAYGFVTAQIEWQVAQKKAAVWYLKKKDYDSFIKQMDLLIFQFPIKTNNYSFIANELIKIKEYNKAYKYLLKKYELKPDAYSSKWLGTIELSRGLTESAIDYLEESLKYSKKNFQVLYNLAGAYSRKEEYNHALELVNKSLELNPNYVAAKKLKMQLVATQK